VHYAVFLKKVEVVAALLEDTLGADCLQMRDNDFVTPLHSAIHLKHLELVQLLLSHGAGRAEQTGREWVDK
jgi:ankyrin repeat protein